MHIDHSKLVELLAEASGIDKEKVESQIEELLEEIRQAVAEDDAYEIEGFGIFSGIGNRIIFIPSKELETEINFKYVGMEPIEVEGASEFGDEDSDKDYDPFEGLDLDEEEEDKYPGKRDPFSGLVVDEEDELTDFMQREGDETTEEGDDDIFGFDDNTEEPTEDDEESVDEEETADETEEAEETVAEVSEESTAEEEEYQPGPEEWGIDSHKESDKSASRLFSSLMGEEHPEEEEEDPDTVFTEEDAEEATPTKAEEELSQVQEDEVFSEDTNEPEADESADSADQEEDDLAAALSKTLNNDGDPFAGLEDDDTASAAGEDSEDIVPVITNISSDLPEQKSKEEAKVKEKKKIRTGAPVKEVEAAPVWLWIVLILVVLIGSIVGLGYFRVLNIPGITPEVASRQPVITTPPAQESQPVIPPPVIQEEQPADQPPQQQEETTPPQTDEAEETAPAQEQEQQELVPLNVAAEAPQGQPTYGLNGVATQAGNDGYTVVLYSLTNRENAIATRDKLEADGYRALVTPFPSTQYGTLWRVSIGQFETQRDAAIATDELDDIFSMNFFIKKITN